MFWIRREERKQKKSEKRAAATSAFSGSKVTDEEIRETISKATGKIDHG